LSSVWLAGSWPTNGCSFFLEKKTICWRNKMRIFSVNLCASFCLALPLQKWVCFFCNPLFILETLQF
jgi:hypothetical protein